MIDWGLLRDLCDESGDDLLAELVDLFCEETGPLIKVGAESGAFDADQLHFLKGSAANLGLRGLANACLRGEQALKDGTGCNIDDVVATYTETREALQKALTARV